MQVEQVEQIDYRIGDEFQTPVSDQGQQGCCLAVATADVVSMVMMISKEESDLRLSPQPMIDCEALSVAKLFKWTTNIGLEREKDYPFTRAQREIDEDLCRIRDKKRYKLHDYVYHDDPEEIKKQIVENFGEGGKKYPILGALYFGGEFADPLYARGYMERKKPYGLSPKMIMKTTEGSAVEHAMVIIGCNTTSTDPNKHYLILKNSHGDWGLNGCSIVLFKVLNYIMVPVFNDVWNKPTSVYVALPLETIPKNCTIDNVDYLDNLLDKVRDTNAHGVMVKVLWGIVQKDDSKEYHWDGYRELFKMLAAKKLKIQVVICLCQVTEGDYTVDLPKWVQRIGNENSDIYFRDQAGNVNRECLSWGIDTMHVFEAPSQAGNTAREHVPMVISQTGLSVYRDLLEDFQKTFATFLKDESITIIEIGLGPDGEIRYPSYSYDDWKYPGIGAFQCYDKNMKWLYKSDAEKNMYSAIGEMMNTDCSYNAMPNDCNFFRENMFDSMRSRYFLNWYAQQLVNHGHLVLSMAREIFGNKIELNLKLTGTHWFHSHEDESHPAELTSGFYNSLKFNGYERVFKMLKMNKAGLNVTVRSYDQDQDSEQAKKQQRDQHMWMKEILSVATTDMISHCDFEDDDEDPVPLSSWNALPCEDNESYTEVLAKALEDKREIFYKNFTYHGIKPLLKDPDRFATFVEKMQGK